MRVIRGFPEQGVVACFEEPNEIGDALDLDAPRNAPAKNPVDHLDKIAWHSDFFQYELQAEVYNVTVSHPAVPAKVQTFGSSYGQTPRYQLIGDIKSASHTLVTHNLGYPPLAFVVHNGMTVVSGLPVQAVPANGLVRTVSAFSNSTIVGIYENGISGINFSNNTGVALPAASRTYQVMLFTAPEADPAQPLFGMEEGRVVLGRGKVDSDHLYARQVSALEGMFSLDLGRTADVGNGGVRIISGPQSWTDYQYMGSFLGSSYTTLGY